MKRVFSCLLNIPVLGTLLYIINSYVFSGDSRAASEPAPLFQWIRILALPMIFAAVLGAILSWSTISHNFQYRSVFWDGKIEFGVSPGELIHAVMPSLLGFGIGVYALLFALGTRFVAVFQDLIDEKKRKGVRKHGSVIMLSAEMAYPLVILILVISVGAIERSAPRNPLMIFVAWSAFWYGLIVCIQLVGVLFGLGNQTIIDKLEDVSVEDKES